MRHVYDIIVGIYLMAEGIKRNVDEVLDVVKDMAAEISGMVQGIGFGGMGDFGFGKLPGLPDLAMAGRGTATTTNNNQRTVNMGGIHLTVNGYNVQDDDKLAAMVADKINEMLDEDGSVFK